MGVFPSAQGQNILRGGRKLSLFLLLFMWFGLDNLHCHNHVVDPPVHAGERIVLGTVQLLRVQVKVKEPARRVDLHVAGVLHKGLNFPLGQLIGIKAEDIFPVLVADHLKGDMPFVRSALQRHPHRLFPVLEV